MSSSESSSRASTPETSPSSASSPRAPWELDWTPDPNKLALLDMIDAGKMDKRRQIAMQTNDDWLRYINNVDESLLSCEPAFNTLCGIPEEEWDISVRFQLIAGFLDYMNNERELLNQAAAQELPACLNDIDWSQWSIPNADELQLDGVIATSAPQQQQQ